MQNLSNNGSEEINQMIIDAINEGRVNDMDLQEMHHEIFNTEYFIIGYYQAEEWLKANYGIFTAIDKIKKYETDNFGEVTTDLSSSERVVNMLVYILGEEILYNLDLDEETPFNVLAEITEL